MTTTRRPVVLAAILAIAMQAVLASPAAAVVLEWGTPTATSKFGQGIDFVQPLTFGGAFRRFEIAIDYPKAIGPDVTEVEAPTGGSLRYHLDTSEGQLVPNTPLVAHWWATGPDGTVSVGPAVDITYTDDRFQWRVKSGKYVTLHWYQGDDTFAARAIAIGDAGVEKAAALFGVSETRPIDFFVYADQSSFYDALGPGTRENVGGEAHPEIRTLFALISPGDLSSSWVGTVVPHELTHVVFDDVVDNPYHSPPHWLNEGIAVYLSAGFGASDRANVSQAVAAGTLMPLAALSGGFPTVADRFYLAYAESVSAVDWMVRTFGQAALVKLVKTYATGVDDDAAFTAATGLTASGFDKAWMAANGVTSATQYGPQPAPAGPLPPDWTSSGASAAPGQTGGTTGGSTGASSPPQNEASQRSSAARGSGNGIPPQLLFAALFVLVDLGAVLAIVVVWRRRSEPRPPDGWW